MKDRLKQLRKTLGLTQGAFGKKIGMSDVAISYMESGRTALSEQNILLICKTFTIRESWFRRGEGEMIDEEDNLSKDEAYLLDIFRKISPGGQKIVLSHAENLFSYEKTLRGDVPKIAEKEEAIG